MSRVTYPFLKLGPYTYTTNLEMALQSAKSTADKLADENVDSTDTELRYAAYGARLRTALRAGHRYLAYVRLVPLCLIRTRDNKPLALSDQ
jgi:hypothetical protein